MSSEIFATNEHDILWIDALAGGSAAGGADASDWTLAPAGDADAQRATDQWIAAGDSTAGDEGLFQDGLALTSIDGLPW